MVCDPDRMRLLGRRVRRWDVNIEMNIKQNGLFVSCASG